MLYVEKWLSVSTWRRVHLFIYANRYSAEAYEYPNLDGNGVLVTGGHGATIEEAMERLGNRLAERMNRTI